MRRCAAILILLVLTLAGSIPAIAQEGGGRPPITPDNLEQVALLAMIEHDQVYALAWSPDGKLLAVGGHQKITLYDAEGFTVERVFEGHLGDVLDVAFSPDGAVLASMGSNCTTRLWDVAAGTELSMFQGCFGGIAFSPDGETMVVGGEGVQLCDPANPSAEPLRLGDPDSMVAAVAFSPDGATLASGGWDGVGTVRLWDVATGTERAALEGHTGAVSDLVFSPDGAVLASAGWDSVRLWDPAAGESLRVLDTPPTEFQVNVAFSPDGTLLAVPASSLKFEVWSVATGSRGRSLYLPYTDPVVSLTSVAFSPDGTLLATGGTSGFEMSGVGIVWLWGIGARMPKSTPRPTPTPLPTPTPVPTPLPGTNLYLNENERLTLEPPPANAFGYANCYYACTMTWTITLPQPLQGNAYAYDLVSVSGSVDVRILHTRGDRQTVLAEWQARTKSSGQQSGPELDAQPGDVITFEIMMPEGGSLSFWDYGSYSSITVGTTAEPLPTEPAGPPPESPETGVHPALATGPGGLVHLAWADPGSGTWDVYYARSTDGGVSFSDPVALAAGAPGARRGYPTLAVGPDGSVHVAWEAWQDGNWDIYYTHSDDGGGTFSAPVRVNDVAELDQVRPALAVDLDGTVHLVWQDSRSRDWDIYYARSTDGGMSFGSSMRANDNTSRDQADPAIGVDGQGRVHVAWADKRDGVWHIYHAYLADSAFSSSHPIWTEGVANELPSLTVAPDGMVYIAWANGYINQPVLMTMVTLYMPVCAVSADGGGTFSAPQQIVDSYQYTSIGAQGTALAADDAALHVVAVTSSPREGDLLWYYRSADGRVGNSVQVEKTEQGLSYPTIAIDQDGGIHIAWVSGQSVNYIRSVGEGGVFSPLLVIN